MPAPLHQELASLIEGEVAADPDTLATYSRDASLFAIKPQVVVFPKSSADISKLVGYAAANAERGVSLTPRSGGTDMSGGAIGSSVIVDMSRHFNQLINISGVAATVQPGMYYHAF